MDAKRIVMKWDRAVRCSLYGAVIFDGFSEVRDAGGVATKLGRRFVLSESEPKYIELIRQGAIEWLGQHADEVLCVNCQALSTEGILHYES